MAFPCFPMQNAMKTVQESLEKTLRGRDSSAAEIYEQSGRPEGLAKVEFTTWAEALAKCNGSRVKLSQAEFS